MRTYRLLLVFVTAAVIIARTASLSAQTCSNVKHPDGISYKAKRDILRQTAGLEKLSLEIGSFSLDSDDDHWVEHNLTSLSEESDLVVLGTLASPSSELDEGGSKIHTIYAIKVQLEIAGAAPAALNIVIPGGQYRFSSGCVATVHTEAWDGLRPGERRVFFLKRAGDVFILVGGLEGAIAVSDVDDLHLTQTDPRFNKRLRAGISGLRLVDLEKAIKAAKRNN